MYDQNTYPSYEGAPAQRKVPAVSSREKRRARSPVYAIDFSAQAAGKRIATTKRRIRWRWGYTNQEGLDAGLVGTECRGEEHDVILVWSVTSGKRQILMDGKEVHFSASRSNIIDFSWTTKGNHVMKLTAHASPPMSASQINSNFRQYDLLVDGQSYFAMPKVFELGIKGEAQSHARRPGDMSQYKESQDDTRKQEEEDLQKAIRRSIAESRAHLADKNSRTGENSSAGGSYYEGHNNFGGYNESYAAPSPAPHNQSMPTGMELLNFGTTTAAPPPTYDTLNQASYAMAPAAYPSARPHGAYPSAPPPAAYPSAPVTYPAGPAPLAITYPGSVPPPAAYPSEVPPSQTIGYSSVPPTPGTVTSEPAATGQLLSPDFSTTSAPSTYYNNGFPAQPVNDPFAPQPPSRDEVHSALLGLYAAPIHNSQPATPAGPAVSQPNFESPDNGTATNANLTMNAHLPLNNTEEPVDEFDSAFQNLVNIDDINAPATGGMTLTMVDAEEGKKKRNNEKKGKSTAIPPIANGMVGSNATLSQINQVKTETKLPDPTTIMKPPPPNVFHQNAGHAGALVVHGEGPPPLPQGFGAGYGQGHYGAQTGY